MNAPTRILYTTTTSDVGGAEVFLEDLVGRLNRDRFSPSVLSLCPVGRVGDRIRATGVRVDTLDLATDVTPLGLGRAVRLLAGYLKRHPADLIHSQLYRANVVSSIAARFVRPRPAVVNAQHSLYAMTGRNAERVAKLLRPLADTIVAVSPVVRDYLIETDGVPSEQIQVINNGVDTSRFFAGEELELRRELGLTPEELLILAVGRLSEEKGIGFLLEALAQLVPRFSGIRLAVVGDGPEREALEERTGSLALGEHVSFLGMRSDIPALLRAADVFALPSLKEALPIALLEAMASHCCVVASRVGGVPFALEDGRDGLLVDPGDPAQLVASLSEVLEDDLRRKALGEAGRARVELDFTLEGTARRHEALYDELTRRH